MRAVVFALAVLIAGPSGAGEFIGVVQLGTKGFSATTVVNSGSQIASPRGYGLQPQNPHRTRDHLRAVRPNRPIYRPIFGLCCSTVERRETVVIVQPPETPPEPPIEEVVEVTPPEPPDPRGPRFERARAPGRIDADFAIGDRIPRRQPLVALDWRVFELPEPESGTGYYRVGREVLVLDVFTREILQIATPG